MADKAIHIWLDETSEGRHDAKWIVSLEEGGSSRTLSVHETAAKAMQAGIYEAKSRGLRLFSSKSPEDPNYEIDISKYEISEF